MKLPYLRKTTGVKVIITLEVDMGICAARGLMGIEFDFPEADETVSFSQGTGWELESLLLGADGVVALLT